MKGVMKAAAFVAAMTMLYAGGAAVADDNTNNPPPGNTGNANNDPAPPTPSECNVAAMDSDAHDNDDCRVQGGTTVDSDNNCVMTIWCPLTRDPVTNRVTSYDIINWTGSVTDAGNLDWVNGSLVVADSQ